MVEHITLQVFDPSAPPPNGIPRKSTQYDAFDRPLFVTNALQETTAHQYDQALRTDTIQYPVQGTFEQLTQNVFAETVQQKDALGNTQAWQHDSVGNILSHQQVIDGTLCETLDKRDAVHRLESQTDANGTMTVYKRNQAGYITAEIIEPLNEKLTTVFEPDTWGHPLKVTDPRGNVTCKDYDKRDLVISETIDPTPTPSDGHSHLNIGKQHTYNGQRAEIATLIGDQAVPNQYQEAFIQDGLNRSVGKVVDPITSENPAGLNLSSALYLDPANQVIATLDMHGYTSWHFYDLCGRERFTVDPEGGVLEKRYNSEGQEIYRREYEQRLGDPDGLTKQTSLAQMVSYAQEIASSQDSQLGYFYDANGRNRFTLNGLGFVNEKRFDVASRVRATVAYSQAIEDLQPIESYTCEQIAGLVAHGPSSQNRHTYFVLDEAGRARFTINPEGYVLEKDYDKLGNTILEVLLPKE